MRKRIFATIMAFIICLSLTACDSSALEDGNGVFVKITVDNANILTMSTSAWAAYHYYYLRDTKVVYVGLASGSHSDFISPVISPDVNYYGYDTESEKVIEIQNTDQ